MSVSCVHISGVSSVGSGVGDVVVIAFIGTVISAVITKCESGNIAVTVVIVTVIPGHNASVAAAITNGDVAAIIEYKSKSAKSHRKIFYGGMG
ncbi:Hypothetical predicted protein [Octopus vulgaris]|uniref:Uncharacterized protein n=1 Tax=Octopus vulgaris TaxID=6645 RepID=A0AA36AVV6_OCTVU|nr:Hypothetical predicted protein [Octopus vulgaris]